MELTTGKALAISLIGFSIVFIVLILLMAVIVVMSKLIALCVKYEVGAKIARFKAKIKNMFMSIFGKKNMNNTEVIKESAPVASLAKGSCGDLTLVKVSERDAAMIMAIVADQLKTPINELRFISIKEAE